MPCIDDMHGIFYCAIYIDREIKIPAHAEIDYITVMIYLRAVTNKVAEPKA